MWKKLIGQFEIVDHGIQHEQYFQGCGISYTEYDDIATGMGNNPADAIDDALESLAQSDWETEGMEKRIIEQEFPGKRKLPKKPSITKKHSEDAHYYLSIRVKRAKIERIVFMQGEEATEALSILDEQGEEAAIEYLAQWDNGDGCELADEPGAGTSDDVYNSDDGCILTYNTRLGYIGLERIVR